MASAQGQDPHPPDESVANDGGPRAPQLARRLRQQARALFLRFLRAEATGGALLILAAAVAMVLANSAHAERFAGLWHHPLRLGLGRFALELSLHAWINDGLMAAFFLVVGLEIKRELVHGELASPRRAALPVLAALGGMAVPGLLFTVLTWGTGLGRGWGIPTATDIAFTVGVMTLLGRRVPLWSKVFVTALAIADDLGAVVVIALFYTGRLALAPLVGVAGVTLLLLALNRLRVRRLGPYLILGLPLWVAMLQSGVHATLAGVILGLSVPVSLDEQVAHEPAEPGSTLEHVLHRTVTLFVLPLFALCNAGVALPRFGPELWETLRHPVTAGVSCGLLLGKPLGICAASLLAVRLRLGELPAGATFRQLAGAAMLAGIGFTMSIFIAGLAYSEPRLIASAKLGILLGSLGSALLGAAWLALVAGRQAATPASPPGDQPDDSSAR